MDTSTELGSVAVVVDGELRSELTARVRAKHGETLLPLVAEALRLAAVQKGEVDLIAVGIGPGSFTGTRVGVATAKGLAVALDRPMVGVASLRAIAGAAPGRFVAPVVDAHKGEVYVALYERRDDATLRELVAPSHAPPDEAVALLAPHASPELVTCGSGVRRYPDFAARLGAHALPSLFDAPRAASIALEAIEKHAANGPDDRAALEPLYVRPSDAKLPEHSPSRSREGAAGRAAARRGPDAD